MNSLGDFSILNTDSLGIFSVSIEAKASLETLFLSKTKQESVLLQNNNKIRDVYACIGSSFSVNFY